MMEQIEVLDRIARALERQVSQHDETVELNLKFRAENLDRHNRERDAELKELRETNQLLIEKMNTAINQQAAILRSWEHLEESSVR